LRRIGVDFHVVDGILQGSRTHVLELFSLVIRMSPDIQFVFFLDGTELLRKFYPVFSEVNVELVRMPYAHPVKRLCWQLPKLQRKYRLDILHTQYILPIPSFCSGIVTIHDILFETHPQFFSSMFFLRSTVLMRLSARRASHVFTVSDFSKQAISSRYHIPLNKISVIPNGVDNNRFFPGTKDQNIVERRGFPSKGYLLSVGRLEPRKNHVSLLRAYAQLKNKTFPLVIIGQPHFRFEEIFQLVHVLDLDDHVHILRDVKDKDLPAFYRHAKLFIYPSWAEGFGIPPLEAMASGVPVITSNSTSIPEVVGNAGVLVDPNDIAALAKAMDHLVSSPQFYIEIQQRGLKQAKKFQWSIAAEKVRRIYLNHFIV
jgi:glycosyltransferase involved in cell wall biosynthesis